MQMQTTAELLAKLRTKPQKGKVISLCKACRHVVDFASVGFTSRPVEADDKLTEMGIKCPNCGQWHHSFFLDKWLEDNRPSERAARQTRRDYQRRFKRFQEKTRKRLGLVKNGNTWSWPGG